MNDEALEKLRNRMEGQRQWLDDTAPYIFEDQKHLDSDTPERAYWHYGYMIALRVVLRLLGVPEP